MSNKRPTQADVARIAGVSRATVSYVMNDQVGSRIPISPETRQRVLDVIAEIGYQVDARAQALRSGDTKTIGVILPMYENPFFWQVLLGISTAAEKAGYSVLLPHSSFTPEQEIYTLRELTQQRIDGLILLSNFKILNDTLREANRPIVEISPNESEFDHVVHSYDDSTQTLLRYLFDLGHRRIGFIYGVSEKRQGEDRLHVYREMLEQAGIGLNESWFKLCGQYQEDGYQAAMEVLSLPDRPTALLVINDLLAMAVLRAAADLNLRVPDDLSIASFDDIPFAKYSIPRLTTVTGQPFVSGQEAFKMLIRRIKHPSAPVQRVELHTKLTVRESTSRVPEDA